MKVFISWSGERSKRVAELFKIWLKCVIQASDPWVSTQDIQSGSLWYNEISDQLAKTSIGIVCLTHENKNKPWILFESGALTKGLSSSRVCPFLIDLAPTDVHPPLSQLNLTAANREGIFSLVRTINSSMNDGQLTLEVLSTVFETYWPQFQEKFNSILESTQSEENEPTSNENDILKEILLTVRGNSKRVNLADDYGDDIEQLNFNANQSTLVKTIRSLALTIINEHYKIKGKVLRPNEVLMVLDEKYNVNFETYEPAIRYVYGKFLQMNNVQAG